MSLPPQVNKVVKHRPAAAPIKETMHQTEAYYGLGPSALDPGLSDMTAGTSGVYNPEKVPQNLGHYQQQVAPVKWMHQDTCLQGSGWAQEAVQLPGWGQNFASYMGGVNVRGFHKGVHESHSMAVDNQMQDVYRDSTQWEPMHQLQSYQQQHAPMLQSFQTFRQNKPPPQQQQQFNSGYYTAFTQKQTPMQSLVYTEQPKQQQPLLHQLPQQQQQQQQQQIHHHQQQQQQIQMQQHLQQQMQTQYHQQQQHHVQERQMQPVVLHMSQQTIQQDIQVALKPNFMSYECPNLLETKVGESLEPPQLDMVTPEVVVENADQSDNVLNPVPATQPRRSRRLSREGQLPSAEQHPLNGLAAAGQRSGEGQGATGGVIQRTRKRRASKEINLETLAQQAAKRESLPTRVKEDVQSGRQSSMAPLVIPVSVPVLRAQQQQGSPGGQTSDSGWSTARPRTSCVAQSLHKPSVIVARRRSLRNSVSERTLQDGENDSGTDEEGKPRLKRRPRPEPLIIPPPRPSSFIPPSVYSSITPYQSHLRSPVHPLEQPLMPPPYTPPPILSPVRAGSGLYFSTFLSNMAATGTQGLPPAALTKNVTVSLLRLSSSASSATTPPLTIVTDVTPVSLEPHINIGQQYQADIPDLLSPRFLQQEQHEADLLWQPMETEMKHEGQDSVCDLMNLACSSVLCGGGTNQELVLHCLFQSRGDVLETLQRLMLQDVLFPKGHPLYDYHYSGSDSWTPEEKHYFNKGISAYRKDFIMVQKLVQTKSVAQCVEFYYTYKRQVKVGRRGALTFGTVESVQEKQSQEEVIESKRLQQPRMDLNAAELNHQQEALCEESAESRHQERVVQSLQAHDYVVSMIESEPISSQPSVQTSPSSRTTQPSSAPPRPCSKPQAKKAKAPTKPPADPNQVFPCKKCGRVFQKVKSRSAHMKSHAEQEKKAAALRLRQQEEQTLTRILPGLESRPRRPDTTAQGRTQVAVGLYGEQGSGAESSEADDVEDKDWH